MRFLGFLLRRIVGIAAVMIGVSVITFAMSHVIPADPAAAALGDHATAEQIAEFRAEYHLDRPLAEQYLTYAGGILRGDLGRSIRTRRAVAADLADSFPATLELSFAALFVSLLVGLPAGVWSAVFRGRLPDLIVRLLAHARANTIAWTALAMSFLALSGGAYAALSLPAGSVGTRQLRNGSITPAKLDPRAIGGSVRHWAQVNAAGSIVSSSSHARDTGVAADGDYVITWSDSFPTRCVPGVTVLGKTSLLSPAVGFANVRNTGSHPTRVWVSTYDPQGTPKPAPFSLAVIC